MARYITEEAGIRILFLARQGHGDREIAEAVGASRSTVHRYRTLGVAALPSNAARKKQSKVRLAMGRLYRCSEAAVRETMGTLTNPKKYKTVQERTTKEDR